MMKRILTVILLALTGALAAAQNLYVATDRSCYLAGDGIAFSAFSAHGPSVAYLELVSSEGTAASGRLALENGRGAGVLMIPFGTPTGNYRLVSYLPGSAPDPSRGPVISVFNTLSLDRVKAGVEVVDNVPPAPGAMQAGYGVSVDVGQDSVIVQNTSGKTVSVCVSLYREDSLQPAARSSIAGFSPGQAGEVSYGETISGRVVGQGLPSDGILAVPGSKTDCYCVPVEPDGSFRVDTENIYGDVDLVCIPLDAAAGCHVELDSPFGSPVASGLPKLQICPAMEQDLLRREAELRQKCSSDTLGVTLPLRQEHFFLDNECISYILDDYTRFPTMEEVFVEIIPQVKLRRKAGVPHIYVLMPSAVTDGIPRWGDAMVMVDGVPVPDQRLIEGYDPAIVRTIEVYQHKYTLGKRAFDGVVNLVTFDGKMPGLLFDDSVRIYSYRGCSLPQAISGGVTLFWHPMLEIPAGGSVSVPCGDAVAGVVYSLTVEGIAPDGMPVYFRKTFLR